MSQGAFRSFCVVGLGNHALTKIIPAIHANNQRLVAVVTSQASKGGLDVPAFENVHQALVALPPDTVFYVSTPPDLHFEQAARLRDEIRELRREVREAR